MADKRFLDRVYDADGAEQTRTLYDAWAASYEAEVGENGYATPRRLAEALCTHMTDPNAPVLDFGCGTGLSGLALQAAGLGTLDGADLSAEMLALARAKGAYRELWHVEAEAAMPGQQGDYAAITAIGVIGRGAAPIGTLDRMMAALAPGGLLGFSFNDHALADPENEARVTGHLDSGRARLLVRDYGAHLPGIGLKSVVYIIEKM